LYSSPNIGRIITSKKVKRTGHIAYISVGESHLGNLDADGRKILQQILKEKGWKGMYWINLPQDKTSDRLL
jgi:hypothetical protein